MTGEPDADALVAGLLATFTPPLQSVRERFLVGDTTGAAAFLSTPEAAAVLGKRWREFNERANWDADHMVEGMGLLLLMAVGTKPRE